VLDLVSVMCYHGWWTADLLPDGDRIDGGCFRRVLNGSITVPITFGGSTPMDTGTYDANTSHGLALRALYSFFFHPGGVGGISMSAFHKCFEGAKVRSFDDAVKCCRAAMSDGASSPPLLVLVDELTQIVNHLPVDAPADAAIESQAHLVHAMTSLLSSSDPAHFSLAVATGDAEALAHQLAKHSRRDIMWATLPALDRGDAERLIGAAVGRITAGGASSSTDLDAPVSLELRGGDVSPLRAVYKPEEQLPEALRVAIADCNGHPQSLKCLLEGAVDPALAQSMVGDPAAGLAQLRDRVKAGLSALGAGGGQPFAPPDWAILAALGGMKLPLGKPVPGSGSKVTLSEHIARGLFINTDATHYGGAAPKLSVMQLLAGVESCGPVVKAAIEDVLAVGSVELLQRRDGGSGTTVGSPLGTFVARWAWLRMVVARSLGRTTMNLLDVFNLGGSTRVWSPSLRGYLHIAALPDPTARIPVHELPSAMAGGGDMSEQDVRAWSDTLAKDGVYFFRDGAGNAAFDVLVLARDAWDKGERVALALDAKFATLWAAGGTAGGETGSVVTRAALEDEHKLLGKLDPLFGAMKLTGRVAHVVVPMHDVSADVDQDVDGLYSPLANHGLLVLQRDECMGAFTPTLAHRAQLLLEVSVAAAKTK